MNGLRDGSGGRGGWFGLVDEAGGCGGHHRAAG